MPDGSGNRGRQVSLPAPHAGVELGALEAPALFLAANGAVGPTVANGGDNTFACARERHKHARAAWQGSMRDDHVAWFDAALQARACAAHECVARLRKYRCEAECHLGPKDGGNHSMLHRQRAGVRA